MNSKPLTIVAFLLLTAFGRVLLAQEPPAPPPPPPPALAGSYELQNQAGDPIEPGASWTITIFPTPIPGVYRDVVDRDGEHQEDEDSWYIWDAAAEKYLYFTDGGTEGEMTLEADGRWKATMTNGDHKGRSSWLDPS